MRYSQLSYLGIISRYHRQSFGALDALALFQCRAISLLRGSFSTLGECVFEVPDTLKCRKGMNQWQRQGRRGGTCTLLSHG